MAGSSHVSRGGFVDFIEEFGSEVDRVDVRACPAVTGYGAQDRAKMKRDSRSY